MSFYWCLSLSICLSFCVSVHQYLCMFLCPPVHYIRLHLCGNMSAHPILHVYLYACLSVSFSVFLPVCPSITACFRCHYLQSELSLPSVLEVITFRPQMLLPLVLEVNTFSLRGHYFSLKGHLPSVLEVITCFAKTSRALLQFSC